LLTPIISCPGLGSSFSVLRRIFAIVEADRGGLCWGEQSCDHSIRSREPNTRQEASFRPPYQGLTRDHTAGKILTTSTVGAKIQMNR
jgi:hypothetical protein